MLRDLEGQTPEERRAFLEAGILQLPFADFSGGMYLDALRTHAVPIVDLLVQINNEDITRQNPVVAEYQSERGGEDLLYARSWSSSLANALNDLGHAAGLRLAVAGGSDGTQFQLPERFRESLEYLQLPPALMRRVDTHKEATLGELDKQIRAERTEEFRKPSLRGRLPRQRIERSSSPLVGVPPDFTLALSSSFNLGSYGSDYQRPTWSYGRLNHTVSLAQGVQPK